MKASKAGKQLTGESGILTSLIKKLTEAVLTAELEEHLKNKKPTNRKKGYTSKTIKSTYGCFELKSPRDRAVTFKPQLIKNRAFIKST